MPVAVGDQHVSALERRFRVQRNAQPVERIDLAARVIDPLEQYFRPQALRCQPFALPPDARGKQRGAQGSGMASKQRSGDLGAMQQRPAQALAQIVHPLRLPLQQRLRLRQALAARFEPLPRL